MSRRSIALAVAAVTAGMPLAAAAQTAGTEDHRGYWWYQTPPKPVEKPPEKALLVKPAIPPMAELATWTPPRIRTLIEQQRDYAATVLTVDAVADFWRLEDFARRKARAFAGVTQIAMLQHPELNARSANPLVGDARDRMAAWKDDVRRQYLRAHANEFALVMLSRNSCGYCRVQWPIVERFRLDRRPDVAARFGVSITPTTMVIRRGSARRMVIASGVETYPTLEQMAYQAVRLLTGDIRPEQFMTGAGEEGGFFDALANGPVAVGGAEPTASAGQEP